MIVPISSHDGKGKPKAYEVPLTAGDGELEADCAAIPHQVRTITWNDDRILEKWGRLSADAMEEIEDMLWWATSDGVEDDD